MKHVVAIPEGGCMVLACLHCGARVTLKLPISVDDLCAIEPGFTRQHKDCEKPAEVRP